MVQNQPTVVAPNWSFLDINAQESHFGAANPKVPSLLNMITCYTEFAVPLLSSARPSLLPPHNFDCGRKIENAMTLIPLRMFSAGIFSDPLPWLWLLVAAYLPNWVRLS